MREAHVPAQQPEAQENSRLPAPDAHARRARGSEGAAGPGPQASLRLIWRVRDRATFAALARATAIRRGALSVRSVRVADPDSPPCVAYAIGRSAGNAVLRNRIRRRLRAAVRELAHDLEPGRAYLLGARSEAMTMPYRELVTTVEQLLRTAREPR